MMFFHTLTSYFYENSFQLFKDYLMMKLTLMYSIRKFLQLVIKNTYRCPIGKKLCVNIC